MTSPQDATSMHVLYPLPINTQANITEEDINSILSLFEFPVEHNSFDFTMNKQNILKKLRAIETNNNQHYNNTDLTINSIFNIYDDNNILNSGYGSTYNEFLQTAYTFYTFMLSKQIKAPLYYNSNESTVIDNMAVLNYFLNTKSYYDTLIISLGSISHATCLLLRKIDGTNFTKVMHINTGYGLNSQVIQHNNKNFFDLFEKTIYLTPELHNAFILFLKPFFFFRNVKKSDNKFTYEYAMNVISNYSEKLLGLNITDDDLQKMHMFYNSDFKNINEYYIHIYNEIDYDEEYTYTYLNDVFNLMESRKRIKKISDKTGLIDFKAYNNEYTRNININYEAEIIKKSNIFYTDFISRKQSIIDNTKTQDIKYANYLTKALNNMDLHFNNKLYIASQSAGTCVFKSLLVSIFYHLIDVAPQSLIDIYLEFCLKCYTDLSSYFTDTTNSIQISFINEFINTSKLSIQLIKDKIIDEKFSPNNMIINNYNIFLRGDADIDDLNIRYDTTTYTSSVFIQNIKVSTIPMSDLNNLLNNIRNKGATKRDVNVLINTYLKNDKYDDILRTYGELVLIGFIWELYFNYDKWEPIMNNFTYHNSNLIYLNLLLETQSRIDFTINEINWICKSVYYFMFHHDKIKEYKILNMVLDYKKLKKDIKTVTDDDDPSNSTQILVLFKGLDYFKFNRFADYYIYNKSSNHNDNIIDVFDKVRPQIQGYIVLYLDYLFAKNENNFNDYFSSPYLLDYDISNINRFFINYFKSDNNYYIELEHIFKILYESKTISNIYMNNNSDYNEDASNIKNIYIYNSLIHIYNLYYVYLTEDEKYKFLKHIFINFKSVLKYDILHIIKSLLSDILYSLNTIFDDIYLNMITNNDDEENMKFSNINSYDNLLYHKRNLYNINGSSKIKYNINDDYFNLFLYKNILTLFENNKKIDKSEIDTIIRLYRYNVNSPYFKYNSTDKTKMDLIVYNKTITSTFDEIFDFQTQANTESLFLLGEFLLNDRKNKCYIDENKQYLVFVLKETNYRITGSIMPYDVIIVFTIEDAGMSPKSFKLSNNPFSELYHGIYINSNPALLNLDHNAYAFMANASPCTINIIELNNNNFIIHCISNVLSRGRTFMFDNDPFHKIIIENYNNYYTSFQIKPNYLTAYSNLDKVVYLKKFYKIFPPYRTYVETWSTLKSDIDYTKIIKLKNIIPFNTTNMGHTLQLVARNFTELSDAILAEAGGNYTDLVSWINNNTDNINKDTIVPYNGNFKCDLKCVKINTDSFKEKINKTVSTLQLLLEKCNKKLNHDYPTYFEFLYNNYEYCYAIMIINIYVLALNRLLNVANNCEIIFCHELLEMNQIFEKRYNNDKISILSGMVEIVFGNLLKNEQWEKIFSMYDNYKAIGTPGHKWEVHQFMMGKGKSSIITPMLLTMLYYNRQPENIYVVVPEHLKQQTRDTLAEYRNFFNMPNIKILTDSEIKLVFLEKLSFENSIVLIDEFDYMYNPIQSNFNKIEYATQIDLNLIDKVFNIVHKIIHFNTTFTNPKPFRGISEVTTILNDSNNIKHVSYGMSIKDKYRYCIPYLRKDSPNEGSKFSSILLTMVLTILYFYNKEKQKYILEEKDIRMAFSDKKLFNKLRKIYNIDDEDLEDFLYKFKLININDAPIIPENIMILYLKIIFLNFKKSEMVMNCSFIDIINAESIWQVGYSGTVNIDMNIKPLNDTTKYNIQIVKDNDENLYVSSALTHHPSVLQINNVDNMFNIFVGKKFNVLIDECAFLKDYDNKQVAEILFTKILEKHKVKKTIIYLLSNDTKMIYNGSHHIYEEKMYKTDEVIYYYSQRHIVGIDIKQPTLLTGLVLLNSNSIYTNVSQAIFRMRKLNKGHFITIGYVKTPEGPTITLSSDIYELLNKNELALNEKNKLLLIYQYLKFYVRKYHTHHYYEVDLDMFKDLPDKQTIYKKIAHNVFSIKSEGLEWINKYVNSSYQTYELPPNDSIVKDLLNMLLLENNLNDLLKLVFNTNSIQKEISSEVQTTTESQVAVQKQIAVSNESSIPKNYTRLVVKYNPFYEDYKTASENFRNLNYQNIEFNNGYTLLFSYNLFHNISECDSAIIVEISDKVYLLDHISMINHYVYMCRIYNLNGRCINNFIFKDKPFINFSDMFNYTLVYDEEDEYGHHHKELNIGYILFNIDNEEKPSNIHKMPIFFINKLILLICVSNIIIFKRNDLYIQEIKTNFDFHNIDLINPNPKLIEHISKYTIHFYQFVSNNYNTSSNDLIKNKTSFEYNIETQHTLIFDLNKYYNSELFFSTVAV